MIYSCYYCGWRINSRSNWDKYGDHYDVPIAPHMVGTHITYRHMAFCSEYCVEQHKHNPKPYPAPSPDWWENGRWGRWKELRKVGRVRPKRKVRGLRKKLHKRTNDV